ncbi:uromodulin-like 1 [Arapaima gigas]
MRWINIICFALSFWGLSLQHTFEGYDLSHSGYHLCANNETKITSRLMSYKVSYIERRPCGAWLPWKICQKTLFKTAYRTVFFNVTKEMVRCCDGYEQVGSYCALPMSRSAEFSSKPGICPRKLAGAQGPRCEWDTDCPGWHKCCNAGGFSYCTRAEAAEGRWCLNVTVTVKENFQMLQFSDKGILNHTRLLHSMVTGALGSTLISVHHIYSQSSGPLNTFSSLLLCSSQSLSASHTAGQLQLLLQRIEEVLSIEVKDTDECAHVELNNCPPEADCINTDGLYSCMCHSGFIDINPNGTGPRCQGMSSQNQNWTNPTLPSEKSSTEYSVLPYYCNGTHNMTSVGACNHGPGHICSIPEAHHFNGSNTTAPSNGSHVDPANSTQSHLTSHPTLPQNGYPLAPTAPSVMSSGPRTATQNSTSQVLGARNMPSEWNNSSIVAVPGSFYLSTANDTLSTTHCPLVVNVLVSNVTSSTFSISWGVHTQHGQPSPMEPITHTFQVLLLQESQVLTSTEVMVLYWVTTDLEPGVLYTVRIVQSSCANHSTPVEVHVRTDAQTLKAKTRLTNVQFKDTLLNSSSQDYHDLCQSFVNEIRRSLSGDFLALLDSGAVTIRIVDLAPGSVVVNYVIIFRPEEKLDIKNVSLALLTSLQNSSKYIVDNNTSVDDFDECISRQTDCSPFASCVNTWGSFMCICTKGFIDTNAGWPGRTCEVESPTTAPQNLTVNAGNSMVSSGSLVVSSGNSTASPGNPTFSPGSPPVSSGSLEVTPKSSTPVSPVWVSSQTGAVNVECRANEFFVTVARDFLRVRSIAESSLYLGSPDCGVTGGNKSHIQLNATWDRCNTRLVSNSTHSTAQVILFSNMTTGFAVISSNVYLQIPIVCRFGSNILISTGFSPLGFDMIKEIVEGSGTFHVSFQLLNGSFPLPQNYTISPNEEVVIEIGINTTVPQIKLITNRCWATPSSNPSDTTSYEFLKNSCPVASTFTTVLQNGNSSRSRLSVRIFSTIEESVIYLHCQIQICVEMITETCKSDCRERTGRTANIVGTNRASCGPIYKSPNGSTNGKSGSMQDVGFIILGVVLCLLVIFAALAVIRYYRSRVGRYSFSFKPKQEKFTYHIFDT